jgi:hypothetical protein
MDRNGGEGLTDVPSSPPEVQGLATDIALPRYEGILPTGDATVVSGNPEALADFNHKQGLNPYLFENDCGLVSAQDVLNQFDIDVTEADVVKHAVEHGECHVNLLDLSGSGGTSPESLAALLDEYGVSAHVETGCSLEDLAAARETGHCAIAAVNAGELWQDPIAYEDGSANHAIVVTAVARDPQTGDIQGFYINDSGTGDSGRFVDTATMQAAFTDAGGRTVITDRVAPEYRR